jgi:Zn-dependent peptidase ImmA (M78 family)/transcriptional regulator with XRE-family HTH domain
MGNNLKPINPEMVTLARESRGITQPELAQKLQVNQGWISRVEGGLRTIQPELLTQLANVLDYPKEFFFQREKIYGLGINSYFHRKKQSLSGRTLRQIHASIYIRTMHIIRLLRGVDIEESQIKSINVDDFGGDAEEVARLVRASWKLPHGPIQNVIATIENMGGIIVPIDFGTNEIDAIYHNTPESPPLFFVNAFSPTDRLRFTLCHELGHAVIHSDSFDPITLEQQASNFAAEFMMPKNDIFSDLTDLSLERLMVLKQYWKVSMSALLKRAGDINAITPMRSQQLWKQMSKAGFRKHEPPELNLPYEEPNIIKQIIDVYFEEMDYAPLEFAKLITLNPVEAKKLYIEPYVSIKDKETKNALIEVQRMLRDNSKN